jgi:hypothetical protein
MIGPTIFDVDFFIFTALLVLFIVNKTWFKPKVIYINISISRNQYADIFLLSVTIAELISLESGRKSDETLNWWLGGVGDRK